MKKLFTVACAGILVATGLKLVVQLMWTTYYSYYPLAGYERAMASGLVDPAFYNSSRSLLHAAIVFFVCVVLIPIYDHKRVSSFAQVFLFCAVLALSIFAYLTPGVQESNLGPLTPFFLAIYTGPSFVAGVVVGLFIYSVMGRINDHFDR